MCATRYEDACRTPDVDERCITCRGGRGWHDLIEEARPKTCCQANSRLVTKEQRAAYKLAGGRMWFICKECARTHPFDPTTYEKDR